MEEIALVIFAPVFAGIGFLFSVYLLASLFGMFFGAVIRGMSNND